MKLILGREVTPGARAGNSRAPTTDLGSAPRCANGLGYLATEGSRSINRIGLSQGRGHDGLGGMPAAIAPNRGSGGALDCLSREMTQSAEVIVWATHNVAGSMGIDDVTA